MLKGLGQLGDMAKIMKQAQEMQSKMVEMQEALETLTVTGESGAGLVKATATAKGELIGLDIDPVFFGVVLVMAVVIGSVTPPVLSAVKPRATSSWARWAWATPSDCVMIDGGRPSAPCASCR